MNSDMAKVRQGQTLIDVALAENGAVEAVWEIAKGNGVGLTDAVEGTEVTVGAEVEDEEVVAALRQEPAASSHGAGAEAEAVGTAVVGESRIADCEI